jgi:hypothetical protein
MMLILRMVVDNRLRHVLVGVQVLDLVLVPTGGLLHMVLLVRLVQMLATLGSHVGRMVDVRVVDLGVLWLVP